jgi:hypothetical protein
MCTLRLLPQTSFMARPGRQKISQEDKIKALEAENARLREQAGQAG